MGTSTVSEVQGLKAGGSQLVRSWIFVLKPPLLLAQRGWRRVGYTRSPLGGHWGMVAECRSVPWSLLCISSQSVGVASLEWATQVIICRAKGTALPLLPLGDSNEPVLPMVTSFA